MIVHREVLCPKTAAEWLASADPAPLLSFPHSDRKLRLFACACCRRIWHLLSDERCRAAVIVAERYADGHATTDELVAVREDAAAVPTLWEVPDWNATNAVRGATDPDAERAAAFCSRAAAIGSADASSPADREAAKAVAEKRQADTFRDITRNPFCPVALDPGRQTAIVVSLAQAIYDERAFDRLSILADALEDAGCTNAEILQHCRLPGEHVRGCWVVDLLLRKE
jgi:hypothetical protein